MIPPLEWHKSRVEWAQGKFGVSDYAVFWIGFGEGVLFGAVGIASVLFLTRSFF
ncbi:MAG: hypothetical protein AB8B70_05805 [Prochlorococcus sp.]